MQIKIYLTSMTLVMLLTELINYFYFSEDLNAGLVLVVEYFTSIYTAEKHLNTSSTCVLFPLLNMLPHSDVSGSEEHFSILSADLHI